MKTIIFLSTILSIIFSSAHAQWPTSSANIYNSNTGFVGINTGSTAANYKNLLTVYGGDITILEAGANVSADLNFEDKVGGKLKVSQNANIGSIDILGTSTELRIGSTYDPANCMTIFKDGKVTIGGAGAGAHLKRSTGYRLFVKDGIMTEKLRCLVVTSWPDFVFDKNYHLKSLTEVEKYIAANKHLPEVPSADEMYKKGMDVVETNAILLQKIEELTLYMIEINKKNEKIRNEIEAAISGKK